MLGNPIRYTGRFYDETTGLYDNRLRNYHPVLGRFIEPDPIGPAYGPQSSLENPRLPL